MAAKWSTAHGWSVLVAHCWSVLLQGTHRPPLLLLLFPFAATLKERGTTETLNKGVLGKNSIMPSPRWFRSFRPERPISGRNWPEQPEQPGIGTEIFWGGYSISDFAQSRPFRLRNGIDDTTMGAWHNDSAKHNGVLELKHPLQSILILLEWSPNMILIYQTIGNWTNIWSLKIEKTFTTRDRPNLW